MLDSLVRVSRRVGGAADLLGREMRTATERCSLYESSQLPVGRGARTPGAASRTDNFTQSLRSEPNGSCRKLRRKCTQEPSWTERAVIADRTHPDRPTPSFLLHSPTPPSFLYSLLPTPLSYSTFRSFPFLSYKYQLLPTTPGRRVVVFSELCIKPR